MGLTDYAKIAVANPDQEKHGNSKRQPRIVTYSLRGPYLISSLCFIKNREYYWSDKDKNYEVNGIL